MYLFRAVDSHGEMVDFYLSEEGPRSGESLFAESLVQSGQSNSTNVVHGPVPDLPRSDSRFAGRRAFYHRGVDKGPNDTPTIELNRTTDKYFKLAWKHLVPHFRPPLLPGGPAAYSYGNDHLLAQVSLQRVQVLSIPPAVGHLAVQVRTHLIGESFVLHYQASTRTLRLQLECDDRVKPFGPYFDSPRLDDSPIGSQFYVPA